ncbi:rhodopsin-like orphan GPCR [Schistosoma japonicum]|uniref:Rhodopsin-like orphan GPCR n=1 Tax=Schistosoma japonicum TaxID=6182 RepID=A0A4Z2DU59_SCHJA|nr:rhodopsin-like orphan GPCR [Schistosoma japonicum]
MSNLSEYPGEIFRQCDLLNIINSSDLQIAKCNLSILIGVWAAYLLPLFGVICMISNLTIGILIIAKANRVPGQMIWICGICLSNVVVDIMFIWLWQFPSKGLPYASNQGIFFSIAYVSSDTCRLFYYVYSYSSTLMCNMRVCSSLNRCLAVYMPSKYKSFPIRYRWYIFISIVIITGLLMIPFGTTTGWFTLGPTIRCWMNPNDVNIHFLQTLLSNLGPIQTVIVIILDIIFLFKVHKYLKKQINVSLTSIERSQLNTSILLLLSSISFICISLPQAVLSIITRLGVYSKEDVYMEKGHTLYNCNVMFVLMISHFTEESAYCGLGNIQTT